MCTDHDVGFGLVERWRRAAEVVAAGAPWTPPWRSAPRQIGSVTVHRVRQHRHLGEDAFYVVRNLWIDPLRRVRVSKSPTGGPRLSIPRGTFRVACGRAAGWGAAPAPLTLGSIKSALRFGPIDDSAPVSEVPTLLVSRDGTHNAFHSMADLLNAFLMRFMFPYQQIVLLDDHPGGPFAPLWSPLSARPVLRLSELSGRTLLRAAAFAPPGGCCFLWKNYGSAGPPECAVPSPLLKAFRDFLLDALQIEVVPRPRPTVTLIRRCRRAADRADRRIANEDDLLSSLRALGGIDVQAVDLAELPVLEQVRIACHTDLLIGVHGAGLAHLLWLPPQASVLELFPRRDGMPAAYGNMATWLGRRYQAWHAPSVRPEWAKRGVYVPELNVDPRAVGDLAGRMLATMPLD
jgi:glycosyl transferase family 61